MILYELTREGKINRIEKLPPGVYLSCAFGCFDGVHLGHQALIRAAISSAIALEERCNKAKDAVNLRETIKFAPSVWTFSHPVSTPWIIPVRERLALCGKLGVRYAVCEDFSEVRDMSPRDFVCSLAQSINLCHAVCGYNFRFGKNREGDADLLGGYLRQVLNTVYPANSILGNIFTAYDPVTVIPMIAASGGAVSSTRIRSLIHEGDMDSVATLLGRRYSMTGTILPGKQIGRTLSKPTANLRYSKDQLIPKLGVYFALCRLNGKNYRAVTNIGYRPTLNSDISDVTCEAHLLDFADSVYGETVEICFCHYARGEIAFPSLSELSAQINNDVMDAIRYFNNNQDP